MGKLATIPGADLVIRINAAHRAAHDSAQQAHDNAKTAMEQAAECGRLLIASKETVGHGEWLPWLGAHTEISPRQAQKYMQLARRWPEIEGKCAPVAYLNHALKLISESKPEPVEPEEDEPEEDEPEEDEPEEDEPEEDEPEERETEEERIAREASSEAYAEAFRKSYEVAFPGREMPQHWCGVTDKDELAWFDEFNYGIAPQPSDEPARKSSYAMELILGAAKSARESAAVLRENEGALEVNDELLKAVVKTVNAWSDLEGRLAAALAQTDTSGSSPAVELPPKIEAAGELPKKRGRPAGSKNKPK